MPVTRRTFLALAGASLVSGSLRAASPVRIGVLHSQTGSMALSERPLIDATRLAVEHINLRGGLSVGEARYPLEMVLADGASDPATFAAQARRLIEVEKVASLFGCWTSACRKAVLPVVEKPGALLWYPVQSEGLEVSKHVIYTGLVANQQLYPALDFLAQRRRRSLYLLGSDYVYPRTTHQLARQSWESRGRVVGEAYRPLGETDFRSLLADLKRHRPDAILNTLNGASNVAFFRQFLEAGWKSEELPVMSLSMGEVELQAMGPSLPVGHFAAWDYFMSLDLASNRRFVRGFRQRFGADRVTGAPMAAAYGQVLAYARAVERAGSLRCEAVREAARGLHYQAPAGLTRIDPGNLHAWIPLRIGQVRADGQFSVVWSSDLPFRPEPFPTRGGAGR